MKNIFYYVAMSVVLLSGCVATPNYMADANDMLSTSLAFSPAVSPEGARSFTAVGHNIKPSYAPPDYSFEKTHRMLISAELGKRQYCMDGYTVNKKADQPSASMTIYEGVCK